MSGDTPRPRYADGQLDDVSHVLCAAHPRSAEYLEQAPALALLACEKLGSHVTYGEVDAFAALIATGPRLRAVLAHYGATQPIRKIGLAGLRVKDRTVLAELVRLDASTLAQAIPSNSQRVWLDGIRDWMRLAPAKKKDRAGWSVEWIARQLGADLSRIEQVGTLIDFIGRGGGVLNERWSWQRAMEAVDAWHRSLRSEAEQRAMIAARKQAASFDVIICKASLPEDALVDGFDFKVLRTLRQLREEGSTMHHCVASYAGSVKRGDCAIISVRRSGVNVATLEIDRGGRVQQIKAHCNQAVSTAVRSACDLYALLHWRAPEAVA